MQFFDLPYDVRHRIYHHLFPQDQQIYIQVSDTRLVHLGARGQFPVELLHTCRALSLEASEYIYNKYLFNIVGSKHRCLRVYQGFLDTVKKHARDVVHLHALSNGEHSATMCISIHVGDGRLATVDRRGRGERRDIEDLKSELGMTAQRRQSLMVWNTRDLQARRVLLNLTAFVCALLALLGAYLSAI